MLESRCGLLAQREESGPKTTNENSSSQTTADGSDTAWQDAQHNRPAGQCGGFRIGLSSYELVGLEQLIQARGHGIRWRSWPA